MTREITVETPLEPHPGNASFQPIRPRPHSSAPDFRWLSRSTDLLPDVVLVILGLTRRARQTAVARSYYCKLPSLKAKQILILDPMLATGGSAVQAIEVVNEHGVALQDLSLVCIVCAPEGVRAVEALDPGIKVYAAALDRELNSQKYILPGLGDFGDRLYGT